MEGSDSESENDDATQRMFAPGSEIRIVDGLLGSILKALSREASKDELSAAVVSEAPAAEIKESWLKLFSFYNTAMDKEMKKPIIRIKRTSSMFIVRDFIDQLRSKDITEDLKLFVIPWN